MWNSHFISTYILFFCCIGTNSSFNCIPNPCASFFTFNYSWLHRIRTTKFCSGIFFQDYTLKFYRFILLPPFCYTADFTRILRDRPRGKIVLSSEICAFCRTSADFILYTNRDGTYVL